MIRLLDIFFSFIALICLIPIFFIIILILRLTGEGEIFFLQDRVGINEKEFKLIKFATMNKNSPNEGLGNITIKNDPRILPVGKFLRDSKINELPQLVNILKGDMSFIGPRPLVREGYNSYPDELKTKLSSIKPGISGIASIILRNEEMILMNTNSPKEFHAKTLVPYKAKLEIWYHDKKNIFNYLLLIFLTLIVIIFPNLNLVDKIYDDLPEKPSLLRNSLEG